MGYAHVSHAVTASDRDLAVAQPDVYTPVRTSETFVELTYQYQVHPWWQLQPDLQYVFNPGGGLADPVSPQRKIGSEFVLGLRTNILF